MVSYFKGPLFFLYGDKHSEKTDIPKHPKLHAGLANKA